MPGLLVYIVKLSISVSAVYLFYFFILRKLTFYTWNRWYLLGYTFISLIIAFVDVSPLFEHRSLFYSKAVQYLPAMNLHESPAARGFISPGTQEAGIRGPAWICLALVSGAVVLLMRLLIQYISLQRLRSSGELCSGGEVKVYNIDRSIIPFSFGNSIFLNSRLHSRQELQEIIRHEFVHVKQRHSVDIIWSELLCIINWYNPCTWLLRKAIRQNLEFIADSKVLENGINRKEYQYLLLKVMGNSQFSITPKFNFQSLKMRIAMMNKIKTAKVQSVRFLFILPLVTFLLIAFRSIKNEKSFATERATTSVGSTRPLSLAWNLLPDTTPVTKKDHKDTERRSDRVEITDKIATVQLANGNTEEYDLTDSSRREQFEKNYGKIITITTKIDMAPVAVVTTDREIVSTVSSDVHTSVSPATVTTSVKPATTIIARVNADSTVASVISPVTVATTVKPATTVVSTVRTDDIGVAVIADDELNETDLFTITKNTTSAQLDELAKQLKEKGYELSFEKKTYNSKGVLTGVRGVISSAHGHCTFMGSHFEQLTVSEAGPEDHPHFKVVVRDSKRVVI